jgi:hypothetical protein
MEVVSAHPHSTHGRLGLFYIVFFFCKSQHEATGNLGASTYMDGKFLIQLGEYFLSESVLAFEIQ